MKEVGEVTSSDWDQSYKNSEAGSSWALNPVKTKIAVPAGVYKCLLSFIFFSYGVYLSVLVTCYAYSKILTWEKTLGLIHKTACFEENLNQNLSKYIAVAEESYPFLIRDKCNIYVFRQSAELKCTFVRSQQTVKSSAPAITATASLFQSPRWWWKVVQ